MWRRPAIDGDVTPDEYRDQRERARQQKERTKSEVEQGEFRSGLGRGFDGQNIAFFKSTGKCKEDNVSVMNISIHPVLHPLGRFMPAILHACFT